MLLFDSLESLHVYVGERSRNIEAFFDYFWLVVESHFFEDTDEVSMDPTENQKREREREMVSTSKELKAIEYFFEVMGRVFVMVRWRVEERERKQ